MADQDTSAASICARIEESWQSWQEVLARMPTDRLADAPVCDEWTVTDLMGHVAVWDAVAVEKIREVQLGTPWKRVATDERNAREAAARSSRSPTEQREEMVSTHDQLLTSLDDAATLPPESLERISDVIAEDTWVHYDDHAAEVRRWLERNAG
ncbi:MAG: DinB family protein [Chloroflexia bacterium]|nr:DinB family protein [Chloroflexia bacterium]